MSDADEANEDDREEFELPTTWRLILGFLPVDIEALVDILRVLRQEARKTSWPELYQRAASFGISITTIGFIVAAAFLFFERANLADIPLDFTLPYWVFGFLIFLILITFYFLQLMQSINEGQSPIAGGLDDQYAMMLECFLGAVLLVSLILFALQSYSPLDIILIGAVGGAIAGMFVAGCSLLLSGITRASKVVKSEAGPNKSLNEFEKEGE